MPSPKAAVTQAEIARCLKAARAAGYERCRVHYEKADGTWVTVDAGKCDEVADDGVDIDHMIERGA